LLLPQINLTAPSGAPSPPCDARRGQLPYSSICTLRLRGRRVISRICSRSKPCSSPHCTFGLSAPVGQTPTHCPQNTHVVSGIGFSSNVAMCEWNPRLPKLSAKANCPSSAQTSTQRQHITHCE